MGAQTGADRAALDWTIEHGMSHGSWRPKGRGAEDGPQGTITVQNASQIICVAVINVASSYMRKKLADIWIKSDIDPEEIRGRRVLLRTPSGKTITGNLEVESADGHKMLVRVEYNADNPPGTVTLPRPAFRLTQQQFNSIISDGPTCVLAIPSE